MTAAPAAIPPYAYALLLQPRAIVRNLERVQAAGLVAEVPNLWQISLGVLRMWHRVLFRSSTIGTCTTHRVRGTWRARLLENRALRFPFLLAERAVAPLDFSGLVSSPERVLRHLLGAHHDGVQFAYDLEMLAAHPGWLERLEQAVRAVVTEDKPRHRWLRDLTVFEGYHEALLAAVLRVRSGEALLRADEAGDPDLSFIAYLAWCARQPPTPAETLRLWRSGRYTVAGGRC